MKKNNETTTNEKPAKKTRKVRRGRKGRKARKVRSTMSEKQAVKRISKLIALKGKLAAKSAEVNKELTKLVNKYM